MLRDHEAFKLASGLPDWMLLEADVFDTFVQVTVPALARKAVKSLSSVGVGGDVTGFLLNVEWLLLLLQYAEDSSLKKLFWWNWEL